MKQSQERSLQTRLLFIDIGLILFHGSAIAWGIAGLLYLFVSSGQLTGETGELLGLVCVTIVVMGYDHSGRIRKEL